VSTCTGLYAVAGVRGVLCCSAEIAAPLAQTKKITMVSSGKGDVGVEKLTGEVLDIMEKLPGSCTASHWR
jgi:hypothetical protein